MKKLALYSLLMLAVSAACAQRATSSPTIPVPTFLDLSHSGLDRESRPMPHGALARDSGSMRQGAALVIVLAFIVLLTGLVIALFSMSLLDRQISNSSANAARVSAFADGAASAIVAELVQEVVLSSSAIPIASGTLYTPLPAALTGSSAGMLPQTTGLIGVTGTGSLFPYNLLKLSVSGSGQFFYSGTNSSGTAVTIPTSGYSNVIAVSSTAPSLNGRYVTPACWNEHYLLPITSSTDSTPAAGAFTPPSWVLVARDGSNPAPTALTSNMTTSGANPIVGRYAFAIYHEGGLLDVNAAGYPSTTSTTQFAYKPAPAYADLTQIPGLSGTAASALNGYIDQLVAWRNYASAQVPGTSFTSPGFTSVSASNYYNSVVSNTTGFLSVSGSSPNNGQTDQMFTSRQQLILFAKNALGLSGTSLNALNYLATFTRDINQPSLVPARTYDPRAPKLLQEPTTVTPAGISGGTGGNSAFPYNSAIGDDDLSLVSGTADGRVNPSFLAVRVQSPFTRNDGTQAMAGEPLVKKRFNLNRLAWLTYIGPSANRNLAKPSGTGTDADMYTMENTYGISQSWLDQGTVANIQSYFGLTWGPNPENRAQNCWAYVHGGSAGSIDTLNDVAQLTGANAREADFFELLKASINAGALGKASFVNIDLANPATAPLATTYPNYAFQYAADSSVDYQILQIGANIIDQFDADGYPKTIHWTNSGNTQHFAGIQNLPYLNRLRTMVVKAILPSPLHYTPGNTLYNKTTNAVTNTGLGIVLWYPEVWNPHDWNPSNPAQTLGTPAPTRFQISAETDNYAVGAYYKYSFPSNTPVMTSANNVVTDESPGFYDGTYMNSPPLPLEQLTGTDTSLHPALMSFSITQDGTGMALFREPTLLFKPNQPAGSSLAAPGLPAALGVDITNSAIAVFEGGNGGIKRDSSLPSDPVLSDPLSQEYIGFYVGAVPLEYVQVETGGTSQYVVVPQSLAFVNPFSAIYNPLGPPPKITMQFQDPAGQWVTYDYKYSDCPMLNGNIMGGADNGFFPKAPIS